MQKENLRMIHLSGPLGPRVCVLFLVKTKYLEFVRRELGCDKGQK
jgi:hypothetical protein